MINNWSAIGIIGLLLSMNVVGCIPINIPNGENRMTEGGISQDQEENYMTLSSTRMLVKSSRASELEVTITNIDVKPHNFTISIFTDVEFLGFNMEGVDLVDLTEGDDIYLYDIPFTYNEVIPNKTVSFALSIHSTLPSGIVYALSSFTMKLKRNGHSIEEDTVTIFVSQGYEQVASYRMNQTGKLANNIRFHLESNPMLASIGETLTIRVNNTDGLPHYYEIIILDRTGFLRVFQGNEELTGNVTPNGQKFVLSIGTVHLFDSTPFRLSISQIQGAVWSRQMFEISAIIDDSQYESSSFGIDVGNEPSQEVVIEELTFERISESEMEVILEFGGDYSNMDELSLFGISIPNSVAIVVLTWIGKSTARLVLEKAFAPELFASGFSGLHIAVVGFVISTGVGMIVEGILRGDSSLVIIGIVIVAVGVVMMCILFLRKNESSYPSY